MIDFYSYPTINGQAVAIALEKMGIEYKLHAVDLAVGEQKHPEFIKINPSGRIPVIVDNDNAGAEKALTITQTGAILIYLADKTGQLISRKTNERATIIEWLMFQLTDITTNYFNNFYLKSLIKPKQKAAGEFMKQRAINFYSEFNCQLAKNEYICGDQLTIADVAAYPVVDALKVSLLNGDHTHLSRWYENMSTKNSVITGMKLRH